MGFEISHNADDQRCRPTRVAARAGLESAIGFESSQQLQWQIVCAEHDLGLELFQVTLKPPPGITWKDPLEFVEAPRPLWIVGLFEKHAPHLRRMLHQFDVAIRMELAMQGRKELYQIKPFNRILRP